MVLKLSRFCISFLFWLEAIHSRHTSGFLAFFHFFCSIGFAATRLCFQDHAGSICSCQINRSPYHVVELLISICWICSKCSKLLAMDKQSNILLPPVHRPYWKFSFSKIMSTISSKDQSSDSTLAYHVGCLSEEV